MHELAHGLGVVNFVNPETGAPPLDLPDVHSTAVLDTSVEKHWHEMTMTNDDRAASQVNTGNLVWDGEAVSKASPEFLAFQAELEIVSPLSLQGQHEVRLANFGPAPRLDANVKGVELANDSVGDPTDAREPLKNRFKRKIALVSRGNCPFIVKTRNAQPPGAGAALVTNNTLGGPILMEVTGIGCTSPRRVLTWNLVLRCRTSS